MFRFLGYFLRQLAASSSPRLGEGMKSLETLEELEECLKQSEAAPVIIFKHSTRCPISTAALQEMNAYVADAGEGAVPVYLNLVVESRPVSNEIAKALGVTHASPQVFLVSERKALWHASHGAIQAQAVRREAARAH